MNVDLPIIEDLKTELDIQKNIISELGEVIFELKNKIDALVFISVKEGMCTPEEFDEICSDFKEEMDEEIVKITEEQFDDIHFMDGLEGFDFEESDISERYKEEYL